MTRDLSNTPRLSEVMRRAIERHMVEVHTALPALVETYDASTQKVSVQPLIKQDYLDEAAQRVVESFPVINEVPVVFPGAGGFRVTFPIAKGDVVLLVFSEASLDRWLVRGGEVDPADDRRHTLTDAIAIPGLRSFAEPLSSAPTDRMTAGKDGGPVIEFTGSDLKLGSLAVDGLIKGTTFNAALQAWLTALLTYIQIPVPSPDATSAYQAAHAAFATAAGQTISTTVKTQ